MQKHFPSPADLVHWLREASNRSPDAERCHPFHSKHTQDFQLH
jgi:hypothetical protein